MTLPWAKCPSKWVMVKNRTGGNLEGPEASDSHLPAPDTLPHPSGVGALPGLSYLRWGTHKGSGTAAIMLLFALTILSNRGQMKTGLRTSNWVIASYDELEESTLLSREMIAKGLKLLRELGAITSRREGNRCAYELQGIDTDGSWCALPQAHLEQSTKTLRLLAGLRETIKRRTPLDAMKLYMLFLAFRERKSNAASLSYERIREYTGLRREQISIAVQMLVAAGLCRISTEDEIPLQRGQRRHNRYVLCGLKND